jgi:hypothetical protein
MQEPTKQVTPLYPIPAGSVSGIRIGGRSGWLKPERAMWPMPVVMLDVDAQHLLQTAASQISSQSRHSGRKRSSKARQNLTG